VPTSGSYLADISASQLLNDTAAAESPAFNHSQRSGGSVSGVNRSLERCVIDIPGCRIVVVSSDKDNLEPSSPLNQIDGADREYQGSVFEANRSLFPCLVDIPGCQIIVVSSDEDEPTPPPPNQMDGADRPKPSKVIVVSEEEEDNSESFPMPGLDFFTSLSLLKHSQRKKGKQSIRQPELEAGPSGLQESSNPPAMSAALEHDFSDYDACFSDLDPEELEKLLKDVEPESESHKTRSTFPQFQFKLFWIAF